MIHGIFSSAIFVIIIIIIFLKKGKNPFQAFKMIKAYFCSRDFWNNKNRKIICCLQIWFFLKCMHKFLLSEVQISSKRYRCLKYAFHTFRNKYLLDLGLWHKNSKFFMIYYEGFSFCASEFELKFHFVDNII